MSNVYTLDTLKADLDKEFAPLQLEIGGEKLTLRNLMRVNDKDRESVLAALKTVEEYGGEEEEGAEDRSVEEIDAVSKAVTTIFRAVTAENKGEKLVKAIDGDLMLGMKVMELWTEATQPGEAQNSPA